jgi:hypothetical protein
MCLGWQTITEKRDEGKAHQWGGGGALIESGHAVKDQARVGFEV